MGIRIKHLKEPIIPFGADTVDFGGGVIFDRKKWDECYGPNRSEETKRLERYYRDECNAARAKNGLPPI